MCASAAGHCACITTLLGSGADVNAVDKQQCSPLHSAASGGHAQAVKALLEAGAKVCLSLSVLARLSKKQSFQSCKISVDQCRS